MSICENTGKTKDGNKQTKKKRGEGLNIRNGLQTGKTIRKVP